MSEVCHAINECVSTEVEYCDGDSTSTSSSTRRHLVFPSKLSSRKFFRKFATSIGSTSSTTADTLQDMLKESEQMIADRD